MLSSLKRKDPLLFAASILLVVLFAGAALALFFGFIGLINSLVHHASSAATPTSLWRSLAGSLIGLGVLGLIIRIVVKLLAMIAAVDAGSAFADENAGRLRTIAWMMLGLQLLGLAGRLVGAPLRGDINGFHIAFDLTPGGVAIVLLLFILARVFRQGAAMRSDLEGTV
jgi:hypothetical protein